MEIDIKDLLYVFNVLIVPIGVWVWRISLNHKLLKIKVEEMPSHRTINNINITLTEINGKLDVVTTKINHLKDNQDFLEQALHRMEHRNDNR